MEERDRYKIHARTNPELYAEFQLRRNILNLKIDEFFKHIIEDYFDRHPRDDFEFPKGW